MKISVQTVRLLASVLGAFTILTVSVQAQTCTVDWNNVHQEIDGFGASSAWQSTWTTAQADMFFSTNNGIGLSLLRNHIYYASSASSNALPYTTELSIMTNAQARGALIWSAPWTPAVGFKSTNDIYDGNHAGGGGVDGGSYWGGAATNLAYASQLANYVASLTNYGIHLYGISIQNEPDANVTSYEACQWSQANIHDFVTNLYNALAAQGVGSTKIILPESQNWSDPKPLASSALSDSNVAADVGIIADHNYTGNNLVGDLTTPGQLYPSAGKHTWETEVSQIGPGGGGNTYDGSITNAMYWAWRIHLFLTVAQVNAWHYWWLIPSINNTDNEGLTDIHGDPAKRMYVLGQWSRFVRPGYYRIDATNTGSAFISAFNDTNSGNFAIVAVNTNASTINQTFDLANFPYVNSVTPWITSASLSLSNQPSVGVAGSSFSYTLPARSVVTFVGQAVNASSVPPSLTPVADQTMDAGQTLLVTNTATDPNVPPQSLTFSLLNSPAGATLTPLDTTDAQFSWRAPVDSAGTTNLVTVTVMDNGTLLSATNSFNVIVNPLSSLPTLDSIGVSGGEVTLVLNGPEGPDYTLLSTTNLTDPVGSWQVLMTTNSPVTPVTLMDTNSSDPARFYLIEIGP
jgi:glucuronoarabinoxylan endo-1,4-beta-xylanase